MINLVNWKELTLGMYRYVVAANAAYEILVLDDRLIGYDNFEQSKKCNLYLTGMWVVDGENDNNTSFFNRSKIYSGTMQECLNKANEDYKEWL